MRIQLAYGNGHLAVDFPEDRTTVVEPSDVRAVPDEQGTFLSALEQPIDCRPLRAFVRRDSKVCIAFTDITRATPNERIIPWLLEYLGPLVPRENITLLNQLGTHRPNTRAELEQMLTAEVVAKYRVVNHEPENEAAMVQFGTTGDGTPALINRLLAESDVRIVTGFIEPHFFAGFSGGVKGIMPGCAALRTVMSNHGSRNIGSPKATFGINAGNPLWEELRDIALRVGPDEQRLPARHEPVSGRQGTERRRAHRFGKGDADTGGGTGRRRSEKQPFRPTAAERRQSGRVVGQACDPGIRPT
jgi:lactate racemase